MEIQPSQVEPSPKYPHIAVAIKTDGRHIGLLYRPDDSEPNLLHLAWHHILCDESGLPEDYAWSACRGFSEVEGRDLASWLKRIYKANSRGIPYGFKYWPGACFDDDGKFLPSRDGHGLTCATFVMALFEAKSYPVVDIHSWVEREEDNKVFDDLAQRLANAPGISQEHLAAQIATIGEAVRFRPLEVAASVAVYDDVPINFDRAVLLAEQFANDLVAATAASSASRMELIPDNGTE